MSTPDDDQKVTSPDLESPSADSGNGSQSVVVINKEDLNAALEGETVEKIEEDIMSNDDDTDDDMDEYVYSDDFENDDDDDDDGEANGDNDDEVADFQPSFVPGLKKRDPNPVLPAAVTKLETSCGSKVYVVGTAHFSEESQDDVSKTIAAVQPDLVVVELCKSRLHIFLFDEKKLLEEAQDMSLQKIKLAIQQNGLVQGIMHLLFLSASAHLTKQLGMAPGGEFRRAYQEAKKIPGCRLQLGDRPIHITFKRALAALSFRQKLLLAWHLLTDKETLSKEDVEKCKQKDLLQEILKEMTGEFPGLSRVFIDERDTFLASSLRMAAKPLPHPMIPGATIPSVVVGVVGVGHVPGIIVNWDQPQFDITDVLRIPRESYFTKIFRLSVKLTVYGAMGYGCYRMYKWIIPKIT
ncbi:hypothetical protein ACF0H5_014634 [Mactra antiquata]